MWVFGTATVLCSRLFHAGTKRQVLIKQGLVSSRLGGWNSEVNGFHDLLVISCRFSADAVFNLITVFFFHPLNVSQGLFLSVKAGTADIFPQWCLLKLCHVNLNNVFGH
jgi:hypothetical protein